MRSAHYRSFAVSLALAAMMLRALLPDGWMPGASASPLTICSIDVSHHEGKAPAERERTHAPCAFAAAAPLAPPALAALSLRPASEAQRTNRPFAQDP
jgi:hypothetical protein